MNRRILLALGACVAAVSAGARPAAAQTDTARSAAVEVAPAAPRPRHDRNVLTAEDFANRHDASAYDLVRALRPGWLRGVRGASSLRMNISLVVYRDGMRVGGVSALREINPDSIREIRFYDAIDATQRWGTDHGAGAVFITTR